MLRSHSFFWCVSLAPPFYFSINLRPPALTYFKIKKLNMKILMDFLILFGINVNINENRGVLRPPLKGGRVPLCPPPLS